jgi:hypothetical protein
MRAYNPFTWRGWIVFGGIVGAITLLFFNPIHSIMYLGVAVLIANW